ncbi:hypothetical protein J628_3607 [Acinetobacter baumannii 23671]|nr:hypothetical protein J628_3607 [Acinetobacter baumannii 23671]
MLLNALPEPLHPHLVVWQLALLNGAFYFSLWEITCGISNAD